MSLLAGRAYVDIEPRFGTGFGSRLTGEIRSIARAAGEAGSREIDRTLSRVGSATAALGKTLSTRVTLPVLAVGAAGFKVAGDFETAFAQMQGLAGVAAEEVDGLRDAVLGLAGETGRAPQELAEALYFLRSAGIDGQTALDALEVSAKAAAVGIGTTEVVARTLASVLNAYAETGLSAERATDILAATVQEAAFEADELSGAIGRVIPIASTMGVGFDEVGAALATMSQQGLDADEAVTSLRGVLAQLLNPTKEANDTLEGFGLSAAGLRRQLREEGLLSVLNTLAEAFGTNEEAAGQVIGDIRALTGFLNITGQEGEKVRAIFDDIASASGNLDEAFQVASETANFKLNVAMAKAKIALVELGDAVAPVAGALIDFGGDAIGLFGDLPDPVRNTTLAIAGLAAASGPALFIVGKLTSGVGRLIGAAKTGIGAVQSFAAGVRGIETGFGGAFANRLGTVVRGLGPAGLTGAALGATAVIGGLTLALKASADRERELEQQAQKLAQALLEGGEAARKAREDYDDLGELVGLEQLGDDLQRIADLRLAGLTDEADELTETLLEQAKATDAGAASWQSFDRNAQGAAEFSDGFVSGSNQATQAVERQTEALADLIEEHGEFAVVSGQAEAAQREFADLLARGTADEADLDRARQNVIDTSRERAEVQTEVNAAEEEGQRQAGGLATATDKVADSAREAVDDLEAFQTAIEQTFGLALNSEEAYQRWEESVDELRSTLKENGNTLDVHTEKGRANRDAIREMLDNSLALAEALVEETGSAEAAIPLLEDHVQILADQAIALGVSEDKVLDYVASLLGIPPEKRTDIDSTADLAKVAVNQYQTELGKIPRQKDTEVRVIGVEEALLRAQALADGLARILPTGVSLGALLNAPLDGRASGGFVRTGESYMVGEQGAEVLTLTPGGGFVTSHGQSGAAVEDIVERVLSHVETARGRPIQLSEQHHYHGMSVEAAQNIASRRTARRVAAAVGTR